MTFIKTKLEIHQLELYVFLGWSEEERSQPQNVWLDLQVLLRSVPKACETDLLDDTYCYHQLSDLIVQQISDKKYRLIEHLSYDIYHIAKTFFKNTASLEVRITKKPDISYPNAGIAFSYGDL